MCMTLSLPDTGFKRESGMGEPGGDGLERQGDERVVAAYPAEVLNAVSSPKVSKKKAQFKSCIALIGFTLSTPSTIFPITSFRSS